MTVSIASAGLMLYSSGTFSTKSTKIDLAVLLVGYDPSKGYLIKNSWGPVWGMYGNAYVT